MASKNSKAVIAGIIVVLIVVVIAVGMALNTGGKIRSQTYTTIHPTNYTNYTNHTNATTTATTSMNQTRANTTTATTISQTLYTLNSAYNATVGNYMVNATGWALYTYAKDTPYSGNSTCYGECAALWPSFYAANISTPKNINASKFGSITRVGGVMQTTYNGMPLYFYSGDRSASAINGEGLLGLWYVVRVNGTG